jgi:hypothetical protein
VYHYDDQEKIQPLNTSLEVSLAKVTIKFLSQKLLERKII